jgi:hypothetical protein
VTVAVLSVARAVDDGAARGLGLGLGLVACGASAGGAGAAVGSDGIDDDGSD